MPNRHVSLTERMDRFVSASVESGRYEDANQVVCAALENLEREEQESAAEWAALDAALEEGEASGAAEGDVVARIRERAGLPPRKRD